MPDSQNLSKKEKTNYFYDYEPSLQEQVFTDLQHVKEDNRLSKMQFFRIRIRT